MVKNKVCVASAKEYTKEQFIEALKEIRKKGWIPNARQGNDGGAGNTLEDLLGIDENNLPIADTKDWELKTQKTKENYVTLFHMDPYPRNEKFIPEVFLPKYGWPHKQAGKKYPQNEMSFRATLNATRYTNRGFTVKVDRVNDKVLISFDATKADQVVHGPWLTKVIATAGLGEIKPQPYWEFIVLNEKTRGKMKNVFFIGVEKRGAKGSEEFFYDTVWTLEGFDFDLFIDAIENGEVLIDFDARTNHNHGTKFRTKDVDSIKKLYKTVTKVF